MKTKKTSAAKAQAPAAPTPGAKLPLRDAKFATLLPSKEEWDDERMYAIFAACSDLEAEEQTPPLDMFIELHSLVGAYVTRKIDAHLQEAAEAIARRMLPPEFATGTGTGLATGIFPEGGGK